MNEEVQLKILRAFESLLENGLTAQQALEHLDYHVFVKHSNEFHALSEQEQTEIRHVLHSIRLVHMNF